MHGICDLLLYRRQIFENPLYLNDPLSADGYEEIVLHLVLSCVV